MNGNFTKRAEEIGFEIVADLLERQDQVLNELDQLNEKIELMIKSLTGKRDEIGSTAEVCETESENAIQAMTFAIPAKKQKAA